MCPCLQRVTMSERFLWLCAILLRQGRSFPGRRIIAVFMIRKPHKWAKLPLSSIVLSVTSYFRAQFLLSVVFFFIRGQ